MLGLRACGRNLRNASYLSLCQAEFAPLILSKGTRCGELPQVAHPLDRESFRLGEQLDDVAIGEHVVASDALPGELCGAPDLGVP